MQTLSLSNCIVAYYLALKYRCEELLKGAKDFIHANFVSVAETEEFLNMSSKEVQEWISSDEISIRGEEEVFEVVVKWIEANNLRCFYDLFQHVRLVYVPLHYLSKVILPHRFVKTRKKCLDSALDAISCISEGTEEHFFSQSPRKCLRTHEEAIVACGQRKTLCYLPSEDKWYKLADLLSPHNSYSTALSTCHGKLYLIGGNLHSSTSERYEPSLNLWTSGKAPESDVSEARGCSAAATLQGFLYVVGGKSESDDVKRLSTVQKYNPDTNVWQEVSPLSSPRSSVCAVGDGSYLYAIGGMCETGKFMNIVERFNPANNTWSKCRSTLAKRRHAAGAAIKQKVFVFGGLRDRSEADSCEVYDPTTDMWTGISSAVAPRGYTSAVSFKGHIYVLGCFQSEDGSGQEMSLRAYDVDSNRWLPGTKSFGSTFFKISRLRILRDVLLTCQAVAS